MDTHARETLRASLTDELARLARRHAKIDAHLHNADREVPQDWDDRAQLFENDEVLEGLESHAADRIREVRQALQTLDDPAWGRCVDCEESIGVRRLQAMPTATRCIACAEQAEADVT